MIIGTLKHSFDPIPANYIESQFLSDKSFDAGKLIYTLVEKNINLLEPFKAADVDDYYKEYGRLTKFQLNHIFKHLRDTILIKKRGIIDYGILPFDNISRVSKLIDKIDDSELSYIERIAALRNLDLSIKYILGSLPKQLKLVEKLINKYFLDKKVTILPTGLVVTGYDGSVIPLSALSSGENNLVIIFLISATYALYNIKNYNLIFDEPDISLGYNWQEDLIMDIKRIIGNDGKLVILTQSPSLVTDARLHSFMDEIYEAEIPSGLLDDEDLFPHEEFKDKLEPVGDILYSATGEEKSKKEII